MVCRLWMPQNVFVYDFVPCLYNMICDYDLCICALLAMANALQQNIHTSYLDGIYREMVRQLFTAQLVLPPVRFRILPLPVVKNPHRPLLTTFPAKLFHALIAYGGVFPFYRYSPTSSSSLRMFRPNRWSLRVKPRVTDRVTANNHSHGATSYLLREQSINRTC